MEEKKKKLYDSWHKKRTEMLSYVKAVDEILDAQYQADNMMFLELFLNWYKKAKTEEQMEKTQVILDGWTRISNYHKRLQDALKLMYLETRELHKVINLKISKIKELEEKITLLEKEIKFIENGNK